MKSATAVRLPGGYWLEGVCHRDAVLRPLTGTDEAFLSEAEGEATTRLVTTLLARCLVRLGPLDEVSEEAVRSLTVGDREALLLRLRALTLGERVGCVLRCPAPGCGEKMDIELMVKELLVPPYSETRSAYETTFGQNGAGVRVRFRLPNGGDMEAVSELVRDDVDAAQALLLSRCVESVTAAAGGGPLAEWPGALAQHLSDEMERLDPQAELLLNLTCPACGHNFHGLFDTASYFLRELAARRRHFYREVHMLAFHYHWSEAEIMGLTASKRRRYLELLAEELAQEARA